MRTFDGPDGFSFYGLSVPGIIVEAEVKEREEGGRGSEFAASLFAKT
jgi:hypothetical protein